MENICHPGLCSGTQSRPIARREGGFTLVELMMGLAVMTAILAGCFNLLGQALLASERAQDFDFVSQLLQSEMESLRTLQWRQLQQLPSAGTFNPKSYFSIVPLRDYDCRRIITQRSGLQKEVRLRVRWTDMKGSRQSREYVSYFTKDGLYDYNYRAL